MKHEDIKGKDGQTINPLSSWFLGPKAENYSVWKEIINYIFDDYTHWRRNYFPTDPIVVNRIKRREHEQWIDKLTNEIDIILAELKNHYPFYSPRYLAHMLSEQTLPSVMGYFAGMLYNPNNVTDEAAPVTVKLELDVGKEIANMLGYNPKTSWAHITSGGTLANLEALWIARTIQFAPLIAKEICYSNSINFNIKLPKHDHTEKILIVNVDNKQLLSLKPNESIYIFKKLFKHLVIDSKWEEKKAIKLINDGIAKSEFNVSKKGLVNILSKLNLRPVIFISAAHHYSFKKIANILGYGEEAIKIVPVESNFRINIELLRKMIFDLDEDKYIAAVIGILGTTEEGAFDPFHKLKFLRDEIEKEKNISFWLHADAAWGGYVKSLFNHEELKKRKIKHDLEKIIDNYIDFLDVSESMSIKIGNKIIYRDIKIEWKDREVYKSILAIQDADSITIDPHKLGYVPYPAGVVCFKNGIVTEHIKQEANYIFNEEKSKLVIDELPKIDAIGPYIIEGSKPGASAVSVWLAHRVIPLNTHNHGKILRTSLLNTKKLITYINYHKRFFDELEKYLFGNDEKVENPFTFKYLYTPDSNVICFIAIPMKFKDKKLDNVDISLAKLNQLNKKLYKKLTIQDNKKLFAQEFYVSSTKFEKKQYSYDSLYLLLDRLKISKTEYNKNGLFVLRSAVMNPWYYLANTNGNDYLMEFIKFIHKETRKILNNR